MSIFISYDTRESPWAEFLRDVINPRFQTAGGAFVALRDIKSGEDPLKRMLETELANAHAVVPVCSRASKTSPWLWWETAATWVRGKPVHPLFVDVAGNDFGPPLSVLRQGRPFDVAGVEDTLRRLAEALHETYLPLTEDELAKLAKLVELRSTSPLVLDVDGPSCMHAEPMLTYRRIRLANLGARSVRSVRVELTAFEPQGATFLPVLLQRLHGLPHPFDLHPHEETYIDVVARFDGTPALLYLCYDRSSHPNLPNSVAALTYRLSLAVSALDTPRLTSNLIVHADGTAPPSLEIGTT